MAKINIPIKITEENLKEYVGKICIIERRPDFEDSYRMEGLILNTPLSYKFYIYYNKETSSTFVHRHTPKGVSYNYRKTCTLNHGFELEYYLIEVIDL